MTILRNLLLLLAFTLSAAALATESEGNSSADIPTETPTDDADDC
jgi:hypothetical protein